MKYVLVLLLGVAVGVMSYWNHQHTLQVDPDAARLEKKRFAKEPSIPRSPEFIANRVWHDPSAPVELRAPASNQDGTTNKTGSPESGK